MSPTVDPAILESLGLDPATATIASHGGSSFSYTFKVTATRAGNEMEYFVKTGTGKDAAVMFEGEHTSLNAIHASVPFLCPRSYAHGPLINVPDTHFLATDFLDLNSGSTSESGSGLSLAAKLAKLHITLAPLPEGSDKPMFGFPVPTCCGATEQNNGWKSSWADFFAENRLLRVLAQGTVTNGQDRQLGDKIEATARRVVPRLLGEQNLKGVVPVVCHGDLWSGNHGRGRIGGSKGVEEVVFDPSAVYGHSEYDLGIMKMFGGFGGAFLKEYHKKVPKSEPTDEYEDRVALYELYHHLNHWAMFGSEYRSGTMSIMERLISRYG